MIKRVIFNIIGLSLISYFAYSYFKNYSKNVNLESNQELLTHLQKKYPELKDSITLAQDRKDKTKEYIQIIYKSLPEKNHKEFFKEVLLYGLNVISENEDNLTNLSAFTMVMLKLENDETGKQIMKDPLSVIIGTSIMSNLNNKTNFDKLSLELKEKCMKTNPAHELNKYCMIRI